MPYPDLAAGMVLTAGMLQGLQWQAVDQASAATVTNSTTLTNTNLTFDAEAGAQYMYRLLIGYTADDTPDMRFAWTVPTNGEVRRWSAGIGSNATGSSDNQTDVHFRRPATTTNVRVGGTTTADTQSYHEHGLILGGNGGPVMFQFAQWVADAQTNTLIASSRLDWLRID